MLNIFFDYLLNNLTISLFSIVLFFTISGKVKLEYILGFHYFSLPLQRARRSRKNIFFLCFWAALFVASIITNSLRVEIMFLLFFMLEYYERGIFSMPDNYFPTMYFNHQGAIFAPNTRPLLFSRFVTWHDIETVRYGDAAGNYVEMFVFIKNSKKPVKMRILRNLRLRYDEVFELYLRNEPFAATLN